MEDFTAIPNELFQSDFWRESKLSHQAAFIDLFRMRRNSPSVMEVRGHAVTIETDQAFVGLRKLSKRWSVSINTARRYLKIFEKTRLIKLQKTKLGTKINFLCFTRGVSKSDTQTNTQTNTRTNTVQDDKMNKMRNFEKVPPRMKIHRAKDFENGEPPMKVGDVLQLVKENTFKS